MTQISKKGKSDFIGIDVSKDKLDICYTNNSKGRYLNTKIGFKKLIKSFPSNKDIIVVLEPTGGYERKVIYALQAASYNVALANTFKMRNYAKAMGIYAKNDPLDSYVIKSFGEDMYPKDKLQILYKKSTEFKKLESWLTRSRQLVKTISCEKNRYEKSIDNDISKSHLKIIKILEKELGKIEEKIQSLSKSSQLLEKAKTFKKVSGFGNVCANGLLIYLPELGHVSNKRIASIVGTAPFCRESGKFKGKSKISGGRAKLRGLLYMGVLSATVHNKIIKRFYTRLIKKGKPHNLAMMACMRKMLCILNAMVRNDTQWDDNYRGCSS
jgi:transposase